MKGACHTCRSFDAFFAHLQRNPWFTRIETEAAVWAPDSYVRHFEEIAAAWVRALRSFRERGQLQFYEDRELFVVAWILMTARHHLATRFMLADADAAVVPLPAPARTAWLDFTARGLENLAQRPERAFPAAPRG